MIAEVLTIIAQAVLVVEVFVSFARCPDQHYYCAGGRVATWIYLAVGPICPEGV